MNFEIVKYFSIILFATNIISCKDPSTSVNTNVIIEDGEHLSSVFHETRHYRIFLPPGYYTNTKKYPVIYFFHGFGGRYNGPAEGEGSVSAEARYYDVFNGNIERCGSDSLDNIAEYVRNNEVIVAKWDGFVKEQYPRPYDIGPVKQDIQFTRYFEEFVTYIDNNYRTISKREGRAVSGISMGGFMAMNIAAKFPHLVSSASFFCPSGGFLIGPKNMQTYVRMKDLKRNFVGMPIRIHIGKNDFLRQYHSEIDDAFKDYGLYYESWHYGPNYFNGFHNTVNLKGQFDFHLKNFFYPKPKPRKWCHTDVFPDFEVWGYNMETTRTRPGLTIMDDVNANGFKMRTRKWLPDGPSDPSVKISISTDSIYIPNQKYEIVIREEPYTSLDKQTVISNAKGRIKLELNGRPSDVGIYKAGAPGYLSVSGFTCVPEMPHSGETIELRPVFFNKGGESIKNIQIELISNDEDIVIPNPKSTINVIDEGAVNKNTVFNIRGIDKNLSSAIFRIKLSYNGIVDFFPIEIFFFNADFELDNFQVADGLFFKQESDKDSDCTFGEGNGNGIVEPGETVSFLTQVSNNPNYYGIKVFTTDPYVDKAKSSIKYNFRNDWSGAMRSTSEIKIKSNCPSGHIIQFFGEFDYPNEGNIRRDNQAATSFIHRKQRVTFRVEVR